LIGESKPDVLISVSAESKEITGIESKTNLDQEIKPKDE
jgi:hypothetical protein